jgi:DNA-binding NarL/FixJ family response regulator
VIAVNKILDGKKYITASLAEQMANQLKKTVKNKNIFKK